MAQPLRHLNGLPPLGCGASARAAERRRGREGTAAAGRRSRVRAGSNFEWQGVRRIKPLSAPPWESRSGGSGAAIEKLPVAPSKVQESQSTLPPLPLPKLGAGAHDGSGDATADVFGFGPVRTACRSDRRGDSLLAAAGGEENDVVQMGIAKRRAHEPTEPRGLLHDEPPLQRLRDFQFQQQQEQLLQDHLEELPPGQDALSGSPFETAGESGFQSSFEFKESTLWPDTTGPQQPLVAPEPPPQHRQEGVEGCSEPRSAASAGRQASGGGARAFWSFVKEALRGPSSTSPLCQRFALTPISANNSSMSPTDDSVVAASRRILGDVWFNGDASKAAKAIAATQVWALHSVPGLKDEAETYRRAHPLQLDPGRGSASKKAPLRFLEICTMLHHFEAYCRVQAKYGDNFSTPPADLPSDWRPHNMAQSASTSVPPKRVAFDPEVVSPKQTGSSYREKHAAAKNRLTERQRQVSKNKSAASSLSGSRSQLCVASQKLPKVLKRPAAASSAFAPKQILWGGADRKSPSEPTELQLSHHAVTKRDGAALPAQPFGETTSPQQSELVSREVAAQPRGRGRGRGRPCAAVDATSSELCGPSSNVLAGETARGQRASIEAKTVGYSCNNVDEGPPALRQSLDMGATRTKQPCEEPLLSASTRRRLPSGVRKTKTLASVNLGSPMLDAAGRGKRGTPTPSAPVPQRQRFADSAATLTQACERPSPSPSKRRRLSSRVAKEKLMRLDLSAGEESRSLRPDHALRKRKIHDLSAATEKEGTDGCGQGGLQMARCSNRTKDQSGPPLSRGGRGARKDAEGLSEFRRNACNIATEPVHTRGHGAVSARGKGKEAPEAPDSSLALRAASLPFHVGQIVWCKGFGPMWPARIEVVSFETPEDDTPYGVRFYGEKSTAWVDEAKLICWGARSAPKLSAVAPRYRKKMAKALAEAEMEAAAPPPSACTQLAPALVSAARRQLPASAAEGGLATRSDEEAQERDEVTKRDDASSVVAGSKRARGAGVTALLAGVRCGQVSDAALFCRALRAEATIASAGA